MPDWMLLTSAWIAAPAGLSGLLLLRASRRRRRRYTIAGMLSGTPPCAERRP